MKRIAVGLVGAFALAAITAGCATSSAVDEHWGHAQLENGRRMVAYPEAGRMNTAPVLGLDPASAEGVLGSYKKGQQRQAPSGGPSIVNIGR